MTEPVDIQLYNGDYEDLLDLFQMSMGFDTPSGVRKLLEIEKVRGTRYYTASRDGQVLGMLGLYYDPDSNVSELEPPQIIDVAVYEEARRQGVARALVNHAIQQVRAAGYPRVWLYTGGDSAELLTFYLRLGFRLVSVTPEWFGDGSAKAVLCYYL